MVRRIVVKDRGRHAKQGWNDCEKDEVEMWCSSDDQEMNKRLRVVSRRERWRKQQKEIEDYVKKELTMAEETIDKQKEMFSKSTL